MSATMTNKSKGLRRELGLAGLYRNVLKIKSTSYKVEVENDRVPHFGGEL